MKKKYTIFISVVLVICIIMVFVVQKTIHKERYLAGKKIMDGLYSYSVDIGNETNFDIDIIYKDIYYIIHNEDTKINTLYKIDIYTGKKEVVGEIGDEFYCYIDGYFVRCYKDDEVAIYNTKLEKITSKSSDEVVPYKDGYLKREGNKLYYNDKVFRTLKDIVDDYVLFEFYTFGDNTYIYFLNIEKDDNYIYNVNEDIYELVEKDVVRKNNDGLVFFDKDDIIIKNFNGEKKEYKNITKDESLFNSAFDNNMLYWFIDDYIKIYDLEKGNIRFLDYRINAGMSDVSIRDGLLYLVTNDEPYTVYVVKLDELKLEEMSISDLNKKLNDRLDAKIKEIKEKYNIGIKVKKEANKKFDYWGTTYYGETNYDKINDALDDIVSVLDDFGEGFTKKFIFKNYKGIDIYILEKIKSKNSISGEAFVYYDNYAVAADTGSFRSTLCHELMHTMESAAENRNHTMLKDWEKYNPKKFKYLFDYDNWSLSTKWNKYIAYVGKDAYFVDTYSTVNGLEDRARVFENICSHRYNVLNDNPNLLKKARYLESEIKKEYPMLKDSKMFDGLK